MACGLIPLGELAAALARAGAEAATREGVAAVELRLDFPPMARLPAGDRLWRIPVRALGVARDPGSAARPLHLRCRAGVVEAFQADRLLDRIPWP